MYDERLVAVVYAFAGLLQEGAIKEKMIEAIVELNRMKKDYIEDQFSTVQGDVAGDYCEPV